MSDLILNTYINQRKLNLISLILSHMTLKHIILIERDLMYFVFID